MQSTRLCTFPTCRNRINAKGLCQGHYLQQKRGRELKALPFKFPPANSIEEAFWMRVTRESLDACWLWAGALNDDGYGIVEGKRAHRVSYEIHHGQIPRWLQIDHQCRTTACVNPNHLLPVTNKQNQENRDVNKNNTSGARGVHMDKRSGKYVASATHNGKKYSGGAFATLAEADAAAISLRKRLFTNSVLDHQ